MDIQRICEELSDRWPEWSERISLLQFREADGLGAAANDGRSVIYNDRLMSYYTQEHQSFYVAQQIMHLQLNHFARGHGRDPILWKRASDAVVNALLKADGFDLPEDAFYFADAAEQSAEGIYEVLLEDAETPVHELVVIGLVTGGLFQFGNAACFGKSYPYLWHKNSLKIKTSYIHN